MLELPTPEAIRSKRRSLGLTQAELAEAAGVSQSLIARIELDDVDPSYSTLSAIVAALNEAERREVTVEELMNTDVAAVTPEEPVREAAEAMRQRGYSQLPVLDGGAPVGSVTERAIVAAINEAGREELADAPVREVMAAPFPALDPDEPVGVAVRMLEDRAAVLVMEGGRVVGLVTKSDLLDTIEAGAGGRG